MILWFFAGFVAGSAVTLYLFYRKKKKDTKSVRKDLHKKFKEGDDEL